MTQPEHKNARQHSDEMHCSHCGKTWDVNDPEPPECAEQSASDTLRRHQQLRRVRRRLSRK